MNTESKRMVITIIRRIIFSGITLFVVCLYCYDYEQS